MKTDLKEPSNIEQLMELIPGPNREKAESILLNFSGMLFMHERRRYFARASCVYAALKVATEDTFNMQFEIAIVKTRKPDFVLVRQIGMAVAFKFTKVPSASIGAIYNRDHATVLHASKNITKLLESQDKEVTFFYKRFKSKFLQIQNTKTNG